MKAILVGAVESTLVALHAIAAAPDWELAAVLTLPSANADRHSDFVDLAIPAERAGARVFHTSNINADATLALIAEIAPDHIFVIGSSQLCRERFLASAPLGVIGYHPAPLPRLRGRGVIPWTILLGEPITAGTLFRIDIGTDSGPILAQRFFHVAADETAARLYDAHMTVLAEMLPGLLERLARGDRDGVVQDERHATWAARRRPSDGRINWTLPADDIWRLVRACGDPYPGAWTTVDGEHLVIAAASPVSATRHHAAIPGQIVARTPDGFTVRCGHQTGLQISGWRWKTLAVPPLHTILGQETTRP
jgi:methionyl-tRNA formyltransferase